MSAQVTIGIPTFQRPEYLLAAVTSALKQTYENIQVVVCDNGSDVRASAVLQSLVDDRLRIHEHTETIPIFDNWDSCVALAEGTYFLLLSDDDVLYPDAVDNLIAGFASKGRFTSSQIGVSYGRCRFIDGFGAVMRFGDVAPDIEDASETVLEFFNGMRPTIPCAVMMRTADIRAHGGYAELPALGIVRDAKVWILTALRRGAVSFSSKTIADYRVHAASGTYQANVEGALENNLALANLCAKTLMKTGNVSIARKVVVAAKRLNIRVFFLLTGPQLKYQNQPLRLLWEGLRLQRYCLSVRTAPAFLAMIRTIVSPRKMIRQFANRF